GLHAGLARVTSIWIPRSRHPLKIFQPVRGLSLLLVWSLVRGRSCLDHPFHIADCQAVAGAEVSSRLVLQRAIDANLTVAHHSFGLAARFRRPGHLDGMRQRDVVVAERNRRGHRKPRMEFQIKAYLMYGSSECGESSPH